jgi:DNA-binding NarL/FixJ family response regulator
MTPPCHPAFPARPIVLVDDDPAVLEVAAAFIGQALGTPVRCFDSPAEALRDFNSRPDDCSLVITDFYMPGMNGGELVRAMRERAPDLDVIIFSGCVEEEMILASLPANCRFLSKGGGFAKLIEAVHQMALAA